MKICLINSLYKPYRHAGAEIVVEHIINGFITAGHEVLLITLGKKIEVEASNNLKVYRIKPLNIFSFIDISHYPTWLRIPWHFVDVFNLSSFYQVRRILLQEKPNAVITHNLKGIGYLIPGLIRRLGIKHFHTVHDVQLARPSGLIIHKKEKPFLILDKIYEKICLNLFMSPEVIISPSRWLMDYYRMKGFFRHSKKAIIQNPVTNISEPEQENFNSGLIRFLYVGQLEENKGIIFLINTLKKVSLKNWELKIIGSGSSEAQIKELIKDDSRFKFCGYVRNSQLSNFYKQTDYTILPSLCYENSPLAIYESFSCGIPVLASDIGGVSELVKDNYNGFTFDPGDEKNLIKVLEHFLKYSQEYLPEFRKNAFETVKNYTLNKYISRLISLLNS